MESENKKVYLNLPKYLYSDSDSDIELVPVTELLKFREFDRLKDGKFSKQQSYDNIKLLEDVYKNDGITSVLIIEYSLADNKVLLIEGNHRLNVALELGVRYLPARVVKRNSSFPSLQSKKAMNVIGVVPDKYGYVRSNLKPSTVGIQGTKSILTGNESVYENGGQILLAPNGKVSNLSPEQYTLVRTPDFINWFGNWETLAKAKLLRDNIKGFYREIFKDNEEQFLFEMAVQCNTLDAKKGAIDVAGKELIDLAIKLYPNAKLGDSFIPKVSKVVDENGEPLVVYHGTTKNFNEFSLNYATKQTKVDWGKLGFFFTSDKTLAEDFTRYNWGLGDKSSLKKNSKVLECFLSIKNPKIVNARQWTMTSDKPNKLRDELINEKYNGYFIEPLNKDDEETWIRLFGKRGIKELINFQYVAFYPNQIKLADGTNNKFDSNNPDIRFENGGELGIGDLTNVGIIEDEYGNQFKINGNWYHKSIVLKEDKKNNFISGKKYNGIRVPENINPRMVISAFSNPIDENKVNKYTNIMKEEMLSNDFPSITGFPIIISKDDVGESFLSGEIITEEYIGKQAWKVWDGHHRVLAAINANLPYINVRLERSAITDEKELFKDGGSINKRNIDWLQTMPNIIKEMKKRDGDVQPESYYERMAKNIIGSHIGASIFNYGEAIKQKLITIDEAKKIIRSADFEIPNYIKELENEEGSPKSLITSARKMQLRNKLADIIKTLDYKTVDIHSGKSKEDLFIQRVVDMIYNGYDFKSKLDIERIATKEFGFDDAKKVRELTEYAILFVGRDISKENAIKETYDKLVSLYANQPYSTNRTVKSQELGQFSTPAPMAYLMGIYVGIDKNKDGKVFIEPTAGNGMLTIAGNPSDFVVNELDFNRYNNLLKDNYKQVLNQDATKPLKFDFKFDGLLANPPFATTKNDLVIDNFKISGLENQIIVNSLGLLKDDARGAFIIGGHTDYDNKGRLKSLKDKVFFSYLFSRYNVEDVINISGTLYGRQGTTYPIRIILFNGRKVVPEGFFPLKNDKLSLYDPFSTKVINNFDELYKRFEKTLLKTR
jgi:hypothetical protein